MFSFLDNIPLTSITTVVVAVAGGVVAIIHPDVLSFQDYAKSLGVSAGGLGVLGIARSQAGKG